MNATGPTVRWKGIAVDYSSAASGTSWVGMLVGLVFLVVLLAAQWRIFTKAGEAGWKSIIPIYNTIVMLKIVGRPWWWLLPLMFVPLLNVVLLVIVTNDLSKSFGHGMGMTLGLIFLSFIFLPVIGFGGSQYQGPAAEKAHAGGLPVQPAV
jgi:hypothetical protein